MVSVSLSLSPPHPPFPTSTTPIPTLSFIFIPILSSIFIFIILTVAFFSFFFSDRTASGSYFTATDKTVPGNCGHSGIAGLDSGLGMAQSNGQEQHNGPVANMDQSGSHSQAAALFCYGLTPMQHSYMQ